MISSGPTAHQEKEAAYRQLEKLGVDRITADVIADERRKEAHL